MDTSREITQEEATVIGADNIRARKLGIDAHPARLVAAADFGLPIWFSPHGHPTFWVVYAIRERYNGLRSSNIVLLSRRGEVLYAGSANDEG
jgi:hypothetical protein